MAHPVRPQSYVEIRNFYTMTVYEKGAEVVRMQHTLLGEKKFQAGMRLYFQRHDGQAVTCDDFVQAMQDASGVDLAQFRRWYDVAGTPVLDCSGVYKDGIFALTVRQSMNPPFHIPLAVKIGDHEEVLSIKKAEENFPFKRKSKPVPSLLRGFSAPVILNYPYTEADLLHLMAHDDDPFNRWEAAQRLAAEIILNAAASVGRVPECREERAAGKRPCLRRRSADACPRRPSSPSRWRSWTRTRCTPRAMRCARRSPRTSKASFSALPRAQDQRPLFARRRRPGKRALQQPGLSYLMELETSDVVALCYEQFGQADNMTEQFAALACLANSDAPQRAIALDAFYGKWKDEPLVVDKWLAVQAGSRLPGTLARVKELLAHPAFDLKVPNKVYALIRGFSRQPRALPRRRRRGLRVPRRPGAGAGQAQSAGRGAHGARLRPLEEIRPGQAGKAQAQLERIRDAAGLSKDVAEIVGKALA